MGGEAMIRPFIDWWRRRKVERMTQRVVEWMEPYHGEIITPGQVQKIFPELTSDDLFDVWQQLEDRHAIQRHPITKRWIITWRPI